MRVLFALLLTGIAAAKPPALGNGIVRGTIRWIGPRPNLDADTKDADKSCKDAAATQRLIIGPGGAVADVVVWLEGIQDVPAGKPKVARIHHDSCGLSPRVMVVPVQSRIEVRTHTDAKHQINAEGDATEPFTLKLPKRKGKKVRSKPIRGSGVVELGCDDEHSPPHAFVHFAGHAFFMVTGKDGRYEFTGIPDGAYYLRIWHAGWTEKGPVVLHQEIDVAWDTDESLDFRLRDF